MTRSRLILGSVLLLFVLAGVQCGGKDKVAKEKVISRFRSFAEASSRSDFAVAHAIMSPDFRKLQPESTAIISREIMSFGVAPESQWKVSLPSREQAFICPHKKGPRDDYAPNSYGMELVDGEWYLSGEIVNDVAGF